MFSPFQGHPTTALNQLLRPTFLRNRNSTGAVAFPTTTTRKKKKATVSGGLVTHATLHDCDARKIDACKSSSRNVVRLLRRRFGALSLAGVHSLAVVPGCADFAHVRELDAAELAVVVDVGLVEAFAAALFHARLEVGAVDIAVLVEVHLREALGELRLGGRFGLADAAVLVDVEFHHAVAAMAAVVRAVAMPQLVARQPAVLVLVGLVEMLRQARRGGRFGAVDGAVAIGGPLFVARRLVGCGGGPLPEGSAGGGQRQGPGGEQDLLVHPHLPSR